MKTNLVIPETPAKPEEQGTLAATACWTARTETPRTDAVCEQIETIGTSMRLAGRDNRQRIKPAIRMARCRTGVTMKENYSETPRTDLAEENLRALGGTGYVRASHARELERELIVKSANYALAHSNLGREVTKCGQLICDVRYWRDIARRLAENGGGLKRYDSLKYADAIAEYKRSAAIYEAQEIANQELAQERGEESDAATETANRGRAV